MVQPPSKETTPRRLLQDIEIRKFVKFRLKHAGIAKVVLKRKGETVEVDIFASRPGIVIGKKGSEVDKLKEELAPAHQKRYPDQHQRGEAS